MFHLLGTPYTFFPLQFIFHSLELDDNNRDLTLNALFALNVCATSLVLATGVKSANTDLSGRRAVYQNVSTLNV